MDDAEFDAALVSAAFAQAALTGWPSLSVVDAARAAGLPLGLARARFPGPVAVLTRFGLLADAAALAETSAEPNPRERVFDLLMRRFDVLQEHREGMLALLRTLPFNPVLSLMLAGATLRSMGWMLDAAGVSVAGLRGQVRANALVGVWLYALRAWRKDESADLAGTMAALDKALDQAERFSGLLGGGASPADDEALEGVIDIPAEDIAAEQDAVQEAGLDAAATAADQSVIRNPPPPPPADSPV